MKVVINVPGPMSDDDAAYELERIAGLISEGYREGDVINNNSEGSIVGRGWWTVERDTI